MAQNGRCMLLDLPLELREHIYNFVFEASLPPPGRASPLEPALTCVCKQVRTESLPLYYASYTLPVQTFIRCSYHGQVWLRTEQWYHSIPATRFQHIKNFHLKFALIDRYTGERVPIDFHLERKNRQTDFAIHQSFARSWFRNPHRIGDPADFDDLISVLREHISRALCQKSDKLRVEGLSSHDIDALVKVEPDSLPL